MSRRGYTVMPETLSALRQTRGAITAASRVVTELYFKGRLDEDARKALLSLWAAARRLERCAALRRGSRAVKARRAA